MNWVHEGGGLHACLEVFATTQGNGPLVLGQAYDRPASPLRERLVALALIVAGQPVTVVAHRLDRVLGTMEQSVRRFNLNRHGRLAAYHVMRVRTGP
jgi:hypothetical protein